MEDKPLGQTLSPDEKTMLATLADEFNGFVTEIEGVKDKMGEVKAILDEKSASVREQIENIMADVPSFQEIHDTWSKAYVAITDENNIDKGLEMLREYVKKLKSL